MGHILPSTAEVEAMAEAGGRALEDDRCIAEIGSLAWQEAPTMSEICLMGHLVTMKLATAAESSCHDMMKS